MLHDFLQINLLGPALIKKERINNEEIIKPISMLPNVIELTYYSNTLVAHYAIDSLIATSLLSMNLRSRHFICEDDLLQKCQDLSSILQYEFLFCKPCQNFDSKITECLDYLIMKTQLFKIVSIYSVSAFKLGIVIFSCLERCVRRYS